MYKVHMLFESKEFKDFRDVNLSLDYHVNHHHLTHTYYHCDDLYDVAKVLKDFAKDINDGICSQLRQFTIVGEGFDVKLSDTFDNVYFVDDE